MVLPDPQDQVVQHPIGAPQVSCLGGPDQFPRRIMDLVHEVGRGSVATTGGGEGPRQPEPACGRHDLCGVIHRRLLEPSMARSVPPLSSIPGTLG